MPRFLRHLLVFLVFSSASAVFAQTAPPEGWRYPVDSDYSGFWQTYRKEIPVPFHFRADFTGVGAQDDAWILIRTDRPQWWGLFVFLNTGNQPEIQEVAEGDTGPQFWSIQPAPPGNYEVLDKNNRKANLVLRAPGINLFIQNGPNLFFYWDGSRFKEMRVLSMPAPSRKGLGFPRLTG